MGEEGRKRGGCGGGGCINLLNDAFNGVTMDIYGRIRTHKGRSSGYYRMELGLDERGAGLDLLLVR